MLRWWFKHTLKFPLYSPHTLLYSIERNCSLWITIGLAMPRMYRHRISKGELYLRGNYLKIVRSKYVLEKVWNIKLQSSDTARWSLKNICWGSRWLNYELSLILSIERTCKMNFLINTCTIRISDFMSFNRLFALYLLLKILLVYQYSNPL